MSMGMPTRQHVPILIDPPFGKVERKETLPINASPRPSATRTGPKSWRSELSFRCRKRSIKFMALIQIQAE